MPGESGSAKPVAKRTGKKRKDDSPPGPIFSLIMLLFVGGMCSLPVMNAMQIVDDLRLHSHGVIDPHASCYSHQGIHSAGSMYVFYSTRDGKRFQKDLYTFIFPYSHPSGECVVRYDPARPSHVATSWGMESMFRLIFWTGLSLLIMPPLFLLVVGMFPFTILNWWGARKRRKAGLAADAEAATDGDGR